MSMYGMPEPPMPMFGIALGITDNTVLDQLVATYQLPLKKEGAAYKFTISEELSIYAVNANNALMLTNDPELAKATEAGQIANNLTNSAFKNDLMKGAFGFMNLNLDTYPESAKAYIASDAFLNSLKDKLNGFEMITGSTDLKTLKSTEKMDIILYHPLISILQQVLLSSNLILMRKRKVCKMFFLSGINWFICRFDLYLI